MKLPTLSLSRWAEALDDIEAAVGRSEELLELVGEARPAPSAPVAWSPPPDLPPLPHELKARALELLARIAEVERALVDQADVTAKQLGRVKRSDPHRPTIAGGFIDTQS